MARLNIMNSGEVTTEEFETQSTVSFLMELVDNPKIAGMLVEIREAYLEFNDENEISVIHWGDGLFIPKTKKSLEDMNLSLYDSIVDKYGDNIDDTIIAQWELKYGKR